MPRPTTILLALALLFGRPAAWAQGPAALPPAFSPERVQTLLQGFVDRVYLKGFRHLGDERDFDHGHFLYNADGRPVAILYHTQELACDYPMGQEFGYVDPAARNWIQWVDDGRVENASSYLREDYPKSAAWDWFRLSELPGLKSHHTILDKMLDPARVRIDQSRSKQLVFTKAACSAADIQVSLPTPQRERVCLSFSEY